METILWMETYLTKAERMICEERVEEGLNLLNSLLFDEPGYGRLHNMLGWAYMYYGDDAARAERHFAMAMRFAPEYAPPYLHMGVLLIRQGRYPEAIEHLRAGLTRPQALRGTLLENIGQAHELRGEYRLAIRAYREAATASVVDFEVDRLLKSVNRCRRKRMSQLFAF